MQKDDFLMIEDRDAWVEQNCFMIPLDEIDVGDHEDGNEARLLVKKDRPALRQQLLDAAAAGLKFDGILRANVIPISVHGAPGNWKQDDGFNRTRELKKAAEENPEITHVFATRSTYNSPSERTWGMLNDNLSSLDEELASEAEIVNTLVKDIKDNFALGSDFSEDGNITIETITTLLNKNLKQGVNLRSDTKRRLAHAAIAQLPSGHKKYYNYTNKDEAVEKFNNTNPWGLKIKKGGDLCEDSEGQRWYVGLAATRTAINQNIVHGEHNMQFSADEENPVKVMIVGYHSQLWGTEGSVTNFRQGQIDDIEKHNNHPRHLKLRQYGEDSQYCHRYVALPQVLKPAKDAENMDKLVSVIDFEYSTSEEELIVP